MKAAGFRDFMISPESGSQRTLDEVIGKHMQLRTACAPPGWRGSRHRHQCVLCDRLPHERKLI
jgi:hypothetical protein